ncbi:N-acetyltransferase [Marivita sp. XM-24bin2]|jgi:predicted N-acetyltransferase YhbS|uniref:GNAT family N-acetyltransferase n=1 Tax=unclassified Marivita TaxID=2632480 RepID=UPI000D796DC8|nr:N-acetyltransferase [Marivita sp. XM-24bin2]MCR9108216.1 N-acetyltransferase [Paracoccaceae bacterium]PWL37124.1 MAG: GNAT family N-acetyltransferase [Marivita sp. XM-24bin2]
MQFTPYSGGRNRNIADLFRNTFTDSEGVEEGNLIHDLARALLETTPPDDLRVYIAEEAGFLCGCVVFTRLRFDDDPRRAFILSPMAVATVHQRKGVGQSLLQNALEDLRKEGVDVIVTYGDPKYYRQVGFHPVTVETVPAPLPLSMPGGWIAQSLTDAPLTRLNGPSVCVPALNRPDVW